MCKNLNEPVLFAVSVMSYIFVDVFVSLQRSHVSGGLCVFPCYAHATILVPYGKAHQLDFSISFSDFNVV
jgi:hypothetical protein